MPTYLQVIYKKISLDKVLKLSPSPIKINPAKTFPQI